MTTEMITEKMMMTFNWQLVPMSSKRASVAQPRLSSSHQVPSICVKYHQHHIRITNLIIKPESIISSFSSWSSSLSYLLSHHDHHHYHIFFLVMIIIMIIIVIMMIRERRIWAALTTKALKSMAGLTKRRLWQQLLWWGVDEQVIKLLRRCKIPWFSICNKILQLIWCCALWCYWLHHFCT